MEATKKPRKKSVSPTQRALKELRDKGFTAWIVESTIPKTFIKRDFMGFADIIYLTASSIVALQVTSNEGGNHAARRTKIIAEPRALQWLKAGGLIELWSFAKQGPRGEAKTWVLRKEELVASDFSASMPS